MARRDIVVCYNEANTNLSLQAKGGTVDFCPYCGKPVKIGLLNGGVE